MHTHTQKTDKPTMMTFAASLIILCVIPHNANLFNWNRIMRMHALHTYITKISPISLRWTLYYWFAAIAYTKPHQQTIYTIRAYLYVWLFCQTERNVTIFCIRARISFSVFECTRKIAALSTKKNKCPFFSASISELNNQPSSVWVYAGIIRSTRRIQL